MSKKIHVNIVSDPFCSWCWGSEPELRALETLFGDQLEITQHMGYLIPDVREEPDFDYANHGYDGVNQSIADHWAGPQARTGMPYAPEKFKLFSEGNDSGFPVAIAYKAAEMVAPDLASGYLRRLREGIFTNGERVTQINTQVALAHECGIDGEALRRIIESGEAEEAFQDDITWADSRTVEVYPTYFVSTEEQEERLAGYITLPQLDEAIRRLSGGEVEAKYLDRSLESLQELLGHYPRAALAEVKRLFKFESVGEAESWVRSLPEEQVKLTAVGKTFWVEKV